MSLYLFGQYTDSRISSLVFLNYEVSFVYLVQDVTSQCIGYDDLFLFEDDAIRNADFIAVGPLRTKILW